MLPSSRAWHGSRNRLPDGRRTAPSRSASAGSSPEWSERALGSTLCLGGRLALLGLLLRPGSLAQVARLDHRRPAIAILPARLDLDLVGLADEPQDRVVAGPAVVDRFDGRLVRGE